MKVTAGIDNRSTWRNKKLSVHKKFNFSFNKTSTIIIDQAKQGLCWAFSISSVLVGSDSQNGFISGKQCALLDTDITWVDSNKTFSLKPTLNYF